MNGPRERGRPGEDAADRAFDDALALANGPGAGTARPPANDPLSVALGHEPAPPSAAESGAVRGAGGRPGSPRTAARPAAGDPLSVALGHEPVTPSAAGPASEPGAGRGTGRPGPPPPPRTPDRPALTPRAQAHQDRAPGEPERAPRHGTAPRSSAESPGPSRGSGPAEPPHSHALPWSEARRIARRARPRLGSRTLPLGDGLLGAALAVPLAALTDLPPFDSSAMDGWAVAGPGPWRLRAETSVLAGQGRPAEPLLSGHAVRIATGAALPPGTTAVLRSEHGTVMHRTDGEWLRPTAPRRPGPPDDPAAPHPAAPAAAPAPAPRPGQDMRRRGQECRTGDELLPAGTLVTPAVLGLAAAAGYDELSVTMRPRVEILVLGDELLGQGPPRGGRVRDALGPMLPAWLRGLGADVTAVHRLRDDADLLHAALRATGADLVVTTGGTAGGPVDHVHPVLARLGARLLVDGVAVRPGHPMLLAELPAGPLLAGLPGNPLAAVSGVLTLVAPALRSLAGRPEPAPYAAPLTADVTGHPVDTRLVPVAFDDESAARPLHFSGPAMLRGLAAADGMAVIPPGGARRGEETAVLDTGALAPAWGSGG